MSLPWTSAPVPPLPPTPVHSCPLCSCPSFAQAPLTVPFSLRIKATWSPNLEALHEGGPQPSPGYKASLSPWVFSFAHWSLTSATLAPDTRHTQPQGLCTGPSFCLEGSSSRWPQRLFQQLKKNYVFIWLHCCSMLDLSSVACGIWACQVALVVKSLPANAGDIRDMGSIPGSGRSPGGGHGNLLQYSCLENPMDRGTWRDTIHSVTKSQT